MSEAPTLSRFAALRLRKAAGGPVAARRSAAELQRLAALPLSERSAAEKEAVRNARKREKKRKQRMEVAAALAAVASAPALPAPRPPLSLPSPPFRDPSSSSALRCEAVSMQDREDIGEHPQIPASPPAALQPVQDLAASRCSTPAPLPELIAMASCGMDCHSTLGGPHNACSCAAEERRACDAHSKKKNSDADTTHLLTAAAAAIASTPPMTAPAAYVPHTHAHIEHHARYALPCKEQQCSHFIFLCVFGQSIRPRRCRRCCGSGSGCFVLFTRARGLSAVTAAHTSQSC